MERANFKRIVFGVSHRPIDEAAARVALAFAEGLSLDLLGYYSEDADVLALGGMPFAREFRTLEGNWTAIDAERLAREVALVAQRAERQFFDAMAASGANPSFTVIQGSRAEAIRSLSHVGDIVVIAQSSDPSQFVVHSAQQLAEAALESDASALLVPNQIARQSGSVVALAARPGDPGVQAALSIAETLKEKLVIANIGETQEDWRAPETGGIKVQLLQARMAELALPPRLGFLNERLLVIARGLLECSAASLLAARLKVPVLITGSQPE